jgi:glycosyltransferase involved in cell wall biosynthesis
LCVQYPGKFLFHIIGEGSLINDVNLLNERHEGVLFYGSVPQMSAKLYPFDYLLMPSRFEGLPLISIEASLSRVPVIASRAEGLVETLPADWPLFFSLDDLPQFFTIIDRILAGNYDLDALKETAYQFASDQFARAKMIDAYSKIFLSLQAV